MSKNIQDLIEDIEKLKEINESIKKITLKTMDIENPILNVMKNAIRNNIINSTSDVVAVCKRINDDSLEEYLVQEYDKYQKEISNNRC